MKLTRHNGRAGKNDFSFEKIEKIYYYEHYADHVQAQNGRNEKNRHTERNRTVDDLLTNNKTCPEESIYQIGTVEESVQGELLAEIAVEFFAEMEERFGSHVHILDWALHLDEGTPHIHERHVFDCENRYGELCPQQEKAPEELGIPLPDPDKKKGRNNNRKQTFDAECRKMLFRICAKHSLHLQAEPSYGGRGYLEKHDFIIEKQKETISAQREIFTQNTRAIVYQNQVKMKHVKKLRKKLHALKESEGIEFVHGTGKRKHILQKSIETLEGHLKKLKEYTKKLHICGTRNSYSKTDHDATFMRMKARTPSRPPLPTTFKVYCHARYRRENRDIPNPSITLKTRRKC